MVDTRKIARDTLLGLLKDLNLVDFVNVTSQIRRDVNILLQQEDGICLQFAGSPDHTFDNLVSAYKLGGDVIRPKIDRNIATGEQRGQSVDTVVTSLSEAKTVVERRATIYKDGDLWCVQVKFNGATYAASSAWRYLAVEIVAENILGRCL